MPARPAPEIRFPRTVEPVDPEIEIPSYIGRSIEFPSILYPLPHAAIAASDPRMWFPRIAFLSPEMDSAVVDVKPVASTSTLRISESFPCK
jgi:hypothetical protein